jgi:hypothetical protein
LGGNAGLAVVEVEERDPGDLRLLGDAHGGSRGLHPRPLVGSRAPVASRHGRLGDHRVPQRVLEDEVEVLVVLSDDLRHLGDDAVLAELER